MLTDFSNRTMIVIKPHCMLGSNSNLLLHTECRGRSVCRSRLWSLHNGKTYWDAIWGLTRVGRRSSVLYVVPDPPWERGNFWGVCPLKSIGRLCCGVSNNGWTDRGAIWRLTHVGPRNHVLYESQGWTDLFTATRCVKTAMQPFVKILWPPVIFYY